MPADRRFVVWSSLGDVCINLLSFSVSLQIDLMWLCLVLARCIIVGLVGVVTMRWWSRIVLCMSLVLSLTAFMAGCLYASSISSLLCLFVLCLVLHVVFVSLCVGFSLWSRHDAHWFNVVC